jgi:hypothetical protein
MFPTLTHTYAVSNISKKYQENVLAKALKTDKGNSFLE